MVTVPSSDFTNVASLPQEFEVSGVSVVANTFYWPLMQEEELSL